MTWLAVAVGGAIGSVARYAVNAFLNSRWPHAQFPAGTVLVNLIGCFAIGLLAGSVAAERIALRFFWREFVFVGLLGGFTTFSAFGLETFILSRTQSPGQALLNVAIQVIGGLGAVWLGYHLGVSKA